MELKTKMDMPMTQPTRVSILSRYGALMKEMNLRTLHALHKERHEYIYLHVLRIDLFSLSLATEFDL